MMKAFFILMFSLGLATGCDILPDDDQFLGEMDDLFTGMNTLAAAVWDNTATDDMGCDINYAGIVNAGTYTDYYGEEQAFNDTGFTVFMIASLKQSMDSLEALIGHPDANLSLANTAGATAMSYAIYMKNHDMVKMYLDAGVSVDELGFNGQSALNFAATLGYKVGSNKMVKVS